jgi:hypothetical protein
MRRWEIRRSVDFRARRVNPVINVFILPLRGLPKGSIYRAVRGLIYIVQTAPQITSNTRSRGSLQSFIIYNYFRAESIHGRHVSPVGMPMASNLRRRDAFGAATVAVRPSNFYAIYASVDDVSRSRPSSPIVAPSSCKNMSSETKVK